MSIIDLFEFSKSGMFSFQGIFCSGSNVEQWLQNLKYTAHGSKKDLENC